MIHSWFGSQRRYKVLGIGLVGLGIMAVGLTGCGSSDGIERLPTVPVEGQIKFEGKPLAQADVVFHPQGVSDPRHAPARGKTDDSGNFKLTTYDSGDGAPVGSYAVTVAYYPLVKDADGVHAGPNALPRKYSTPQFTDLNVQVSDSNAKLPPLELRR
jgi:hypothetical protein